MRFLYRLRWDNHTTNWQAIPDGQKAIKGLTKGKKGKTNLTLLVNPPTHWQFDKEILDMLDGHIAVEATLVAVEIKAVK